MHLQALGELIEKIWFACELSTLLGRQKGIQVDDFALTRLWIDGFEFDVTAFCAEHHAPAEAMAFLAPIDITFDEMVTNRKGELEKEVE